MQQYWSGDLALYAKLQKDTSPLGKARLHYFWINKGPWSELDASTAFIPGVPEHKLPGANFYPEDMTKEQFESLGEDAARGRAAAGDGLLHRDPLATARTRFKIVPYSEAYKADLQQAPRSC